MCAAHVHFCRLAPLLGLPLPMLALFSFCLLIVPLTHVCACALCVFIIAGRPRCSGCLCRDRFVPALSLCRASRTCPCPCTCAVHVHFRRLAPLLGLPCCARSVRLLAVAQSVAPAARVAAVALASRSRCLFAALLVASLLRFSRMCMCVRYACACSFLQADPYCSGCRSPRVCFVSLPRFSCVCMHGATHVHAHFRRLTQLLGSPLPRSPYARVPRCRASRVLAPLLGLPLPLLHSRCARLVLCCASRAGFTARAAGYAPSVCVSVSGRLAAAFVLPCAFSVLCPALPPCVML